MRQVDGFTPARRATRYPYHLWLVGGPKISQIFAGKDFFTTPAAVAASINAYGKNRGFVAIAYPGRSTEDGAIDLVDTWGDPSRPLAEGLPEEIVEKLLQAGRRPSAYLLPRSMQP